MCCLLVVLEVYAQKYMCVHSVENTSPFLMHVCVEEKQKKYMVIRSLVMDQSQIFTVHLKAVTSLHQEVQLVIPDRQEEDRG